MARKLTDAETVPVMLAAGLEPLVPYPGSNRVPWLSRHGCGREVTPCYSNIQRRGNGGCSVCAGNEVDLDIVMATMLAADLEPLVPYPGGNHVPWLSRHKCGREVAPRYNHIQQGQGGCLVCGEHEVDLEIVMATMLAADLEPLVPYPGGVHEPWRCKHNKCGNEVRPTYANIQKGQGGCRTCAPPGYAADKPACVYLIELSSHPDFPHGVLKIGATGSRTQRLKDWQRRGWILLEVFHFDDGKIPLAIEDDVLNWLNEELGLEPCLSADDVGHMGGYSETISVADLAKAGVSVADVRKKVKQLVKMQNPQLVAGGVR